MKPACDPARPAMRLPVWTNNKEHNRKIHGILDRLRQNWMEGEESVNLPCPFIISAREGYPHLWLGDVVTNGVGWSPMGEKRTREMFKNNWQWISHHPLYPPGSPGHGMAPGVVVRDHSADYYPFKYTKVFVEAWGVWKLYCMDGDREFLQEAYPHLRAYHAWYARERDIDEDLLVEIGSYTGEIQHARFEGADFKPSLDRMVMTNRLGQLRGDRWYGNVETVEMTALLIDTEKMMARIAEELGDRKGAGEYLETARRREEALNLVMWDPVDGFYYDVDRDTHMQVKVKTVWGFYPLCSHSSSAEQAARLVEHLTNPEEFWTPFPIATCARSEPVWRSDGFWRGDAWLGPNWHIAHGLNHYGYYDVARALTDSSFKMVDETICPEHFDSVTGKPLGARYYSFNSYLLFMIYENYYGISEDYRTVRVTDADWGKHIRLGTLEVDLSVRGDAPGGRRIRLCSDLPRTFTVVVPETWRESRVAVSEEVPSEPFREIAATVSSAGGEVSFEARPGFTYAVTRKGGSQE